MMRLTLASTLLVAGVAAADSLASIKHVVLFMQENRAFDHYFGTMAGVRGFSDPNVAISNGKSVFYQDVDASLSKATDSLAPWYLNYLGGTWNEATQCMTAGSNGYEDNQAALNRDLNNKWALNNTPWSWGHFRREDIPVHFGIAEGWTVGDMYQQSVIAATDPNRVSWMTGTINVPGGPTKPSQGGVTLDNNDTPGCEGKNLNCYPMSWKTVPEYYQENNVTWQVYQNVDNFGDDPLAFFVNYQNAKPTSELYMRGVGFGSSLDKFYADCAAGTLPQVSYIVGPAELSEHPPYQPKDGAYLQKQVVDAFTKGKNYKDSVLMISYDETGGWGDHVVPFHSPEGTAGEWMEDPYGEFGQVYSGPGFRLPFYIISPWTRGGVVYSDNADHSSQIQFVEEWLATQGKDVTSKEIPPWRRANMANLVNAFDFANPDLSLPTIPDAETPSVTTSGHYNGYATCEALYPTTKPPVPYADQTSANTFGSEQGFKSVRGLLTEGRFLTFENGNLALANNGKGQLTAQTAAAKHHTKAQRFVLHQATPRVNKYTLSSVSDGSFVAANFKLVKDSAMAVTLTINDMGNGKGYSIQQAGASTYYAMTAKGLQSSTKPFGFHAFSVTYSS